MKLELKHLAPYLPYGLKVKSNRGRMYILDIYSNIRGSGIEKREIASVLSEEMKPILRPLSDLTDRINPIQHHTYLDGLSFNKIEFVEKAICNETLFLSDYNYLLEYHFDIFGLIEKGLAVSYNEL